MTPSSIRHRACLLGAALLLMAGVPARAFDIPPPPPPMYQGLILPLFPNGTTIPFSGQSGSTGSKGPVDSARSTLANGRPQPETSARDLAQLLPPAQRAPMGQAYLQAFEGYRQLERKLGLEGNDLAGSIAAFIAGNYMALNNVDLPDAHFQKLAAQLRASLAQNPGYGQLSATGKRKLYEQTAMVGTFMAVARLAFRQKPNPVAEQHYRDSARANLEMALQVPVEQVRIDAQGLTLAPRAQ